MNQNGKLMPNLDQQSTKVLNLTVLQRIDPNVEEILITAGHVTLYEFNIDLSQWSRKDVEGSLFVVKRNAQPRFQFIVMNRRNTDNLVEDLLGDFEFEVQVPYLLYRNASQEVNGIWFYNTKECKDVGNLFSRIISAYSKGPQKSIVSANKSEFEELEAVPTMAVMDGPLEPPSFAGGDLADDPAFVNFFSMALTTGSTTSGSVIGHANQSLGAMPPPAQPNKPFPIMQTLQASLPPANPLMPLLDAAENSSHTSNLVKPSSFFGHPTFAGTMEPIPSLHSALHSAPPMSHPVHLQRHYGTPMLQPFPPPTPPPSLAPLPGSAPTANYVPTISKDKVRDALQVLVQDDQFIDMVYRALLNPHH